jgi:DGQHR domain-containing protein
MSTIKLDTIKASQPIGLIYVTKISPELLLKMSTVDRRRIADDDEVLGIQRELRYPKVAQIKSYLSSIDATFPNSIIVNTTSEYFLNENESSIELKIDESTFTIIDGQHRVEGFRDNPQKNFELIVAIFKDLRKEQQAEVFSTINSQQTKVDPSHNLNLELDSKVFTPIKMMIQIAQSFNFDKDSPWSNNIRLLGSGSKGILSLSAFVKPLLDLTYPDKDYYKIKNELTKNEKEFPNFVDFSYNANRYLFWEFYTKKDQNSIFKILFNYFKSLAIILNKDWLNKSSLLNKTTGYNAMIKLFKDLFLEGYETGDLSYEFFFNKLTGLKNMNGTITSQNYGTSGAQSTNELYNEMKKNARQHRI